MTIALSAELSQQCSLDLSMPRAYLLSWVSMHKQNGCKLLVYELLSSQALQQLQIDVTCTTSIRNQATCIYCIYYQPFDRIHYFTSDDIDNCRLDSSGLATEHWAARGDGDSSDVGLTRVVARRHQAGWDDGKPDGCEKSKLCFDGLL